MKSSSDRKTGGKKPLDARESHAKRWGERDKMFKLFELIKLKKSIDVMAETLLKSSAILVFARLMPEIIVLISDKSLSSRFTSEFSLKMLRI